jgi:tRNA1(Val) A37 N6-methylase TrmN6
MGSGGDPVSSQAPVRLRPIAPIAGVVRARRRPAGWLPAGPAAPAPDADPALWPGPGEDLCALAGDWRILQRRDGHRWSLDDLATAWMAVRARSDEVPARFADLGCGIGTVLLLLAWRYPDAHGVGVEAQELSAELARRSIRLNGARERLEVRLGDLRDPSIVPEGAIFDLVTGTPPYLPPGTGAASPHPQRAPARLEMRGGIEDYCAAAARLLAPGGCFVACAPVVPHERAERAVAESGLALALRRDVVPRAGKAPLFTLLVARRSVDRAPAERAVVEPLLVVRDAAGRRTDECRAMRAAFGMPP